MKTLQTSLFSQAKRSIPCETFEVQEKPLWFHLKGLSYTASGYGKKIPTSMVLKDGNRWKRIYCRIFSNSGSLYFYRKGLTIVVD